METAIEVVRWSGLILSLLLTLVVLKEVAVVVGTLSGIRALAQRIRDAAVGMADHVEAAERLPEVEEPLGRLRTAGTDVTAAARDVARAVEAIAEGAEREKRP